MSKKASTENLSWEDVKPPMATDTGEPGYHEAVSALAVVSSWDSHERRVLVTAADHAKYRLDSQVANGKRGTYTPEFLKDEADKMSQRLANLVFGRWQRTPVMKSADDTHGWLCLSENGERNLTDRHYIAFVELPENYGVLANRVGRYVAIRIQPEVVVNGKVVASLQVTDKGWLVTDDGDDHLVEGIVAGYGTWREANNDRKRLQKALRTLYYEAQARNATSDDSDSELASLDRQERRLAELAKNPLMDDGGM